MPEPMPTWPFQSFQSTGTTLRSTGGTAVRSTLRTSVRTTVGTGSIQAPGERPQVGPRRVSGCPTDTSSTELEEALHRALGPAFDGSKLGDQISDPVSGSAGRSRSGRAARHAHPPALARPARAAQKSRAASAPDLDARPPNCPTTTEDPRRRDVGVFRPAYQGC
jgi:hypothetical protein